MTAKNFQHAKGIIEATSMFAGPCNCAPGVHVNLEKDGKIVATVVLALDDCDGLIDQIRGSKKAIEEIYAPREDR